MDGSFKSARSAAHGDEAMDMEVSLDSPAIRRLVEEVRAEEEDGVPRSYNRTFNRHNR